MQINWKVRMSNPAIVVPLALATVDLIYSFLTAFGVEIPIPKNIVTDWLSQALPVLLPIIFGVGIVVDGTTKGISDSDRAMTYGTPEDVRYNADNQ